MAGQQQSQRDISCLTEDALSRRFDNENDNDFQPESIKLLKLFGLEWRIGFHDLDEARG